MEICACPPSLAALSIFSTRADPVPFDILSGATNSSLFPLSDLVLETRAITLTGEILSSTTTSVTLAPNASTELFKGLVPGTDVRKSLSEVAECVVVGVRLLKSDGTVIARYGTFRDRTSHRARDPTQELICL